MDSKEQGPRGALPFISSVRFRVFILNAVFFVTGMVISYLFYPQAVLAFVAGFTVGLLNQWLSFQTVTRSVLMEPERTEYFIMSRFYVRFAVVAGLLVVVVWKLGLSPLGVIGGFSVPFLATIVGSLLVTREAW